MNRTSTFIVRLFAGLLIVTLTFSALGVMPAQAQPLYALGTYPSTIVVLGGNTTVTPSAAPTGTTSINVSTNTNFKGTFVANPTTGVVRVVNAHPAGIYTVTVRAFGASPATTTFTLTVTNGIACTATPNFNGPTNVTVGAGVRSVPVGDFNNDGNQDFLAANAGTGTGTTVSVRLGNGTGGFTSAADVTVGSGPYSVAVGDFNNDGNLDFVSANYSANNVSVRLGNGTGGFTNAANVAVGTGPWFITVGDFNNDGNLDFATANWNANTVSIRLGNGAGGFSGTTNIAVGTNPASVAVADFNNDGNMDFATANRGSANASIRFGNGAGGFSGTTNIAVGNNPWSVAVADFNEDGNQDFATANNGSSTVSIRLGNGAGGFSGTTNITVGTAPLAVAVADFNNDGNLDFASANGTTGNVSISLGNGAGGFAGVTNYGVGTQPYAVAIADFNNDGKQDFAAANWGGGTGTTVSVRIGYMPLCYNGNGNTGGTVPGTVNYTPGATVTVLGNTGSLVRTGYTFNGWNTAADGSGTSYAPAATFSITAPTILYANWLSINHTVTFDANGGTGTMAPQVSGAPAALTANAFTRAGYTFMGWNTAVNGSGTAYADGATYNFSADITLYAQWTAAPHTITYAHNPAGGIGILPTQADVVTGGTFTVATGAGLTRPGYTFAGWNDGASTYAANATYTMGISNVTLTAQWTADPHTVTYAHNPAGGTGTLPTQADVVTGGTFTVATGAGLTRPGYTFAGWNDGTSTYAASATYTMGISNVTLTAQWTADPHTVTYAHNPADGTGTLPTQADVVTDGTFIVASSLGLTRPGYTFTGWNDGTSTYAAGATYTMGSANVTLTAQWTADLHTVTYTYRAEKRPRNPVGMPTQADVATGGTFIVASGAGLSRAGYAFVGWSDGTATYTPGSTYTVGISNVALSPQWTELTAPSFTLDGSLVSDGEFRTFTTNFTQIVVAFGFDAYNPPGNNDPDDVTNPANYLVLQTGANGEYETGSCLAFATNGNHPLGDDIYLPTSQVAYSNTAGFVSTITVNSGNPLANGDYRMYICGTTSIVDQNGDPLNGGTDFILNIRIANMANVIPATGFAPDRMTVLPEQTVAYTRSDLWLEIPKLGVQMDIVGVPLVDGEWDVSWLERDAGWLEGSAYPTWNGNSVLTGHVWNADNTAGPFRYLNTLWYGDEIIVHAGGAEYVYSVRSVLQVGPGSTAALLKHEKLPWVTLVTCQGYDAATGAYTWRILVRAVLIAVK